MANWLESFYLETGLTWWKMAFAAIAGNWVVILNKHMERRRLNGE